MSINLCIDWGNSNVKAAIFNDEQIVESVVFSESEAEKVIGSLISAHQPVKAILCSVVFHPVAIEEMIKGSVKAFVKLDNNTLLPIRNAYTSSGTLGADRIALATAAHMLNQGKNNLHEPREKQQMQYLAFEYE